jgi:hypothetical protein
MKVIVRKGYVVRLRGKLYGEGTELPSPIITEVLKDQSWKVYTVEEKVDGRKKENKKAKETETTEDTKKVEDVVNNRMVGETLVKTRGN